MKTFQRSNARYRYLESVPLSFTHSVFSVVFSWALMGKDNNVDINVRQLWFSKRTKLSDFYPRVKATSLFWTIGETPTRFTLQNERGLIPNERSNDRLSRYCSVCELLHTVIVSSKLQTRRSVSMSLWTLHTLISLS